MAIIVDIIFAAIEEVAPLSKEGFSSTMSTPVTYTHVRSLLEQNDR